MAGPGPTPDPCGRCDACVEIAEGRDMDVLEIDAATHTKVENVREVIISGLAVPPVRDRYKIFIIDEVHQLSGHSFNALLKSIEEPPPHVVFMMATTELAEDPRDDPLAVAGLRVQDDSRAGHRGAAQEDRGRREGVGGRRGAGADRAGGRRQHARRSQSAFDQVLAFAGTTVSVDDVSSVLGLVGRDLLLDILEAVADERAPAAFDLAARAVEGGYDLRLLCRELSRLVRDLMVVAVDRSRLADTSLVAAGERARVEALAARFSREDLLRAFDLIAKTESDLRLAEQPRYHLEMALLKWMHLRKLVPIGELLEQLRGGSPASRQGGAPSVGTGRAATSPSASGGVRAAAAPSMAAAAAARRSPPAPASPPAAVPAPQPQPEPPPFDEADAGPPEDPAPPRGGVGLKDALLAEVRRAKAGFYNMTVAQASAIQVEGDAVIFSFNEGQRFLRSRSSRPVPGSSRWRRRSPAGRCGSRAR